MFEQKQLWRIYSVKSKNGDKRVYVNQTSDFSIRLLFENSDIHLTELLTLSKAWEEVEKVKKKYIDDGWIILNNKFDLEK